MSDPDPDALATEILEALLESLAEGMVFADTSGRFRRWNQAADRIIGLGKSDAPPADWSTHYGVFRPDRTTLFPSDELALTEALRGEIVVEQEQFLRNVAHPEGIWLSVSGRPVRDASGTLLGGVVVFRNISDKKRFDEQRESVQVLLEQLLDAQSRELNESEARYRDLLEAAPLSILVLDAKEHIVLVNRQTEVVFGHPRDELLGMRIHRLLPDFKAASAETPTRTAGLRGNRKDGRDLVVDVSLSGGARAQKQTVIVTDLTEQKRLEEQVRQSQKLDAIGRLAGGLAHDLNNLLTIIHLYGALTHRQPGLEPNVRDNLEQILKAAERAGNLTGQLLAFSRQQILEPQVVELNGIVEGIGRMLSRLLGEHITLTTLLSSNLGRVKVDPNQLEQVVMNLALNARDAMPSGGRLTIETAMVDLDEEYARLHAEAKPGPHVMMAVSDTGEGMTPETQSRVFEPFFTTKERGQGTGLGLSTVYGIVKQSGGSIYLYSEHGVGTTFKIYFPATTESCMPNAPAIVAPGKRPLQATILLVEDELALRQLTRTILEEAGHLVLDAGSGTEAVALLEECRPSLDLLLTDIVLPGMTARELALRLEKQFENLGVLYMSGYTSAAVAQHGIVDQAVHFIAKPFTQEALLAAVEATLRERSPI